MPDQNLNPRVLYLSHDGLTDSLGQSQILPYLIGLSAAYRITIISFEKYERLQTYGSDVKRICGQHQIDWRPLIYHKFPPVLSTLYDLFRLRRYVGKILSKDRYAIIHSRSYPMTLVGMRAKRRYALKLIFDMRGFWADERVEGALWDTSKVLYLRIYKFFKRKELEFLTNADHVVSLTENARDEIQSWKIDAAPITVIPTCADLVLFNPAEVTPESRKKLRSELGISPQETVLLYLGSWGTWYQTDAMLQYFDVLKKKQHVSKFLIITHDHVDVARSEFADDIIVRPAKRIEVRNYIAAAEIAICFIKPTFSKKASSATKLGEILAMQVPVIVNRGWGDIELMVKKIPEYLVFADGDVNRLFGDTVKKTTDVRAIVQEMLGLENGIAAYKHIYESLLKS